MKPTKDMIPGLGGLLGGLGDLLTNLADLAEKGDSLQKSGVIDGKDGKSKIMYGFTVKGLGEDRVTVEPFGNVSRDAGTDGPIVSEVREPVVDLIEEPGQTLVIAEMPGVGPADVQVEVHDDVLTLRAEHGDKKYRKEILLPHPTEAKRVTIAVNNGIVELSCPK